MDEIRNLPPGTELIDPHSGERTTLVRHTDLGDGWELSDGSWLRWHHIPAYLYERLADSARAARREADGR